MTEHRKEARTTWRRIKRIVGLLQIVRGYGPEILGVLAADIRAAYQRGYEDGRYGTPRERSGAPSTEEKR